jgi:hypothetical protein
VAWSARSSVIAFGGAGFLLADFLPAVRPPADFFAAFFVAADLLRADLLDFLVATVVPPDRFAVLDWPVRRSPRSPWPGLAVAFAARRRSCASDRPASSLSVMRPRSSRRTKRASPRGEIRSRLPAIPRSLVVQWERMLGGRG